jgi:hypothetical protein
LLHLDPYSNVHEYRPSQPGKETRLGATYA